MEMEEQKISFEGFNCPDCGGSLLPISTLITDWPYVHTDTELRCSQCQRKFVFGIPIDSLAGTGLEIYDNNPLAILKVVLDLIPPKLGIPSCPWHHKPMRLTKIFGDRVFKEERRKRVQFKCTYCYLTYHEEIQDGSIKRESEEPRQ